MGKGEGVLMHAEILGGEAGFLQQKIGMPLSYFEERGILLDCRQPGLVEIDPGAYLGFNVRIYALSHEPTPGALGAVVPRPVRIARLAWIASDVVLHNCEIGEGAVVACGSVVRSMKVEPWTMVAGNPARVIKRVVNGKWEKV
jgi:acetyltransferase-like isoleucine patch superfamily enzyme